MRGILYHLSAFVACCLIPGEIDDGGLGTRMPVLGLTIGITFWFAVRMVDESSCGCSWWRSLVKQRVQHLTIKIWLG